MKKDTNGNLPARRPEATPAETKRSEVLHFLVEVGVPTVAFSGLVAYLVYVGSLLVGQALVVAVALFAVFYSTWSATRRARKDRQEARGQIEEERRLADHRRAVQKREEDSRYLQQRADAESAQAQAFKAARTIEEERRYRQVTADVKAKGLELYQLLCLTADSAARYLEVRGPTSYPTAAVQPGGAAHEVEEHIRSLQLTAHEYLVAAYRYDEEGVATNPDHESGWTSLAASLHDQGQHVNTFWRDRLSVYKELQDPDAKGAQAVHDRCKLLRREMVAALPYLKVFARAEDVTTPNV